MAVTFELMTTDNKRRVLGRKVTSANWEVTEDGGYGTCELEVVGTDPPQVGDCLTIRSGSTSLYRGWCERVETEAKDGLVSYRATFAGLFTRTKTMVLNRRYAARGNQTDVGYAARGWLAIVKSVDPSLPLSASTEYIDTTFGISVPSADWLYVTGEQALRTLRDKCIDGVLVGFGAGATTSSNFLIFRKVTGQQVSWYLSTKRRWVQAYSQPVELGEVVNSLKLICGQSPTPNLIANGALRQIAPASPGAANLLSDPGWEYYPLGGASPWKVGGSPTRFKQGTTSHPYMQPLSGDWLCEIDNYGDTVFQDVRVDGHLLPRTIVGGVYAAKRMTQHGENPKLKVTIQSVDSQGNPTTLASESFVVDNHSYTWYGISTQVPSGTFKVRLMLSADLAVTWPDSSIIMDNAGLFWADDIGQLGWTNWSYGGWGGDEPNIYWQWVADSDEPTSPEPVMIKTIVHWVHDIYGRAEWGTAADQMVGNIRRSRYRLIIYWKATSGKQLDVYLLRKKDNGSIAQTKLAELVGNGQLQTYSHQSIMFDQNDRAAGILFSTKQAGTYWIYGVYLGEARSYGIINWQPLVWVPESRAEYSFRVDNQGPHTIQLDLTKLSDEVKQSITKYGVRTAVVEDDTIGSLDEAKNYALRYFTVKGAPTQSYQVVLSWSNRTPLIRLWDASFNPTNLVRLDDRTYRIKRVVYRFESGQIEQTLDLAAYHPTLEQLFKQQPSPRRPDLATTVPVATETVTPTGSVGAVVVAQTKHNELLGLQGGDEDEYYHLTRDQYSGLTSGGNTSLHTHDDRYGRLAADNTWTGVNTFSAGIEALGGSGSYSNPTIKLAPTNSTTGWSHLELYAGWDSTYDYMIGRGTSTYLSGRALTLHVPSRTLYGGSGDYPKIAFANSGGQTLGWIEADTGNMYISGKLGVGEDPSTFSHRLKVRGQAVATFRMFVESDGHTYPFVGVQQWTSEGTGGVVHLYRAGGTLSSPAPTPSGAEIGLVKFSGVDTSMTARTVAEIHTTASSVGSSGIAGLVKLRVGTSSGTLEDSVTLEPGLTKVQSGELRLTGTLLKVVPASGVPVIQLDSGSGTTYQYANLEYAHGGVRRWNLYKANNSSVDLALARYDSGGAYQGLSLVVKGDTGIVGIGNQSNPSGAQLHVYNTTAGRYALKAETTTSVTSSSTVYDIGAYVWSKQAISSGAVNSGHIMGASIGGWHDGAGNLSYAYGAQIEVGTASTSSGTVDTAYGTRIRVRRLGANSTITTAYGLYIDPVGGATTYGIMQAGSSDKNVFYGKLGLGGRTPTSYPLEIDGSMYLTGSIYVDGTVDGVDISGHAANSDAHHARVHAFDGSDHSGIQIVGSKQSGQTLRYSAANGYWYNDYLSHADLTNVTPDQHHAQVHSLTGSDHTVPSTIIWDAEMRLFRDYYSSLAVGANYHNSEVYMDASSGSANIILSYTTNASMQLSVYSSGPGPEILFKKGATMWSFGWTTEGLGTNGSMYADSFQTSAGFQWRLGGYTAGAPTASGYVSIWIDGTLYKLLAATA